MENLFKELLGNIETKVLFEITSEGKLEMELSGDGAAIMAGLSMLIEQFAHMNDECPLTMIDELRNVIEKAHTTKQEGCNPVSPDIMKDILKG